MNEFKSLVQKAARWQWRGLKVDSCRGEMMEGEEDLDPVHYNTLQYVEKNTVQYSTEEYRKISKVQYNTLILTTMAWLISLTASSCCLCTCIVQYSTVKYSTVKYSKVQYSTV